ncbi:MAG: CBS domain-containing protein [Roseitalea sp.]|jgi:CBS domain-containing protein|nr:CBS domain-containing protein [Roseitalea sp.]MBO6723158.1 CBS domain-containing protein [Roseitalea sp.]MBO6744636.1 CBS domain-containing protein [Roseitalea sp.]
MSVARILEEKGSDVFTLSEDASVLDAVRELGDHKVGAMVVADADRTIKGILSERDVVGAVAKRGVGALSEPVSALMTRNVVTCTEDMAINTLMELMTKGRFRHLPVERDGKLAGIVSIGDVVKRRIAEIEQEAAEIRHYITSSA